MEEGQEDEEQEPVYDDESKGFEEEQCDPNFDAENLVSSRRCPVVEA